MIILTTTLVMASLFFAAHALLNRGMRPTVGRLAGIAGRDSMREDVEEKQSGEPGSSARSRCGSARRWGDCSPHGCGNMPSCS